MRALMAVLVLLASSAAAAPTTTPSATSPGGAPAQKAPASVWRVQADGIGEHLQSGLRCPSAIGDYHQYGLTTYDAYGLDVSCGWNSEREHVAVTLYLTRGTDLDGAFAEATRELLQYQASRNPKLATDARVDRGGLHWRKADYTTDGDGRTDLWMADLHGWMMEYRATYPARSAGSVEKMLDALTALALASAGPHLEACAKAAPVVRDGHRLTDGKQLSQLAMTGAILGGAARASAQEHKDKFAVNPVIFCAQGGIGGAPLLAWTGVHPDGSDAQVDRVSVMSVGEPLALDVAADSLGNVVRGEIAKGAPTPPLWIAATEQGGRTFIFGYFEGRPSAAAIAPLVQEILSGKAKPLTSYGVSGKNISIGAPSSK